MTCKDCLHYEACKDIHDILEPACSGEFDYEIEKKTFWD